VVRSRLVRSKLQLSIKPLRRLKREASSRKFNISSLKSETTQQQLEARMNETVSDFSTKDTTNVEEAWQDFKLRVLDASERTIGFVRRKHRDWFDDNDRKSRLRSIRCTGNILRGSMTRTRCRRSPHINAQRNLYRPGSAA